MKAGRGKRTGIVARCLVIGGCVLLSACSSAFFYPSRELTRTPRQLGVVYQDVHFVSADHVKLHGWWLPAQDGVRGSILFLHGNAQNVSAHLSSVYWLPGRGYNVLLFDYRGYGRSDGTPSIPGVVKDAQAALQDLLARPEARGKPVFVLGQSLGAALAIYLGARSPQRDQVRAVIADSSFASYQLIAREKFSEFWLTWPLQYPLAQSVNDEYSPLESVAMIAPRSLLLIHNQGDRIIPVRHSQLLYDKALEPKALWLLPDGEHIDALTRDDVRERLVRYLDAFRPGL